MEGNTLYGGEYVRVHKGYIMYKYNGYGRMVRVAQKKKKGEKN